MIEVVKRTLVFLCRFGQELIVSISEDKRWHGAGRWLAAEVGRVEVEEVSQSDGSGNGRGGGGVPDFAKRRAWVWFVGRQ